MSGSPLGALGRLVADEQDSALERASADTLPDRLRRIRPPSLWMQRKRRRWWLIGAGVILVGAVGIVAVRLGTGPSRSHGSTWDGARNHTVGSWLMAPKGESTTLRFSDGLQATLSAESRARIGSADSSGVTLLLESGSVELVAGSDAGRWIRVGAGPFYATLEEGRATITWNFAEEELDLSVREGYVIVAGCQYEEGRSVAAGKELRTHCTVTPPTSPVP